MEVLNRAEDQVHFKKKEMIVRKENLVFRYSKFYDGGRFVNAVWQWRVQSTSKEALKWLCSTPCRLLATIGYGTDF
jgi:hypothetical protein